MSGKATLARSEQEPSSVLSVGRETSSLHFRELILQRRGYVVRRANSVEEALAACATGSFSLILVAHLTDTTGVVALIAALKRLHPETPILAVSDAPEAPAGLEKADAYLAMTDSPYLLLAKMEELLAGGRRTRFDPVAVSGGRRTRFDPVAVSGGQDLGASRQPLTVPVGSREIETELNQLHHEIIANRSQPISLLLWCVAERVNTLLAGATGVAIGLVDETGLVCRASVGLAPDVGSRLSDFGLTRKCFDTGKPVLCEDAQNDPLVLPSVATSLQMRSAILVPIQAGGSVVGIVEAFSSQPLAFDDEHVAKLERVASLLASTLLARPGLHVVHSRAPAVLPDARQRLAVARTGIAAAAAALLLLSFFFLGWLVGSLHRPMSRHSMSTLPSQSAAHGKSATSLTPTEGGRTAGGKSFPAASAGEISGQRSNGTAPSAKPPVPPEELKQLPGPKATAAPSSTGPAAAAANTAVQARVEPPPPILPAPSLIPSLSLPAIPGAAMLRAVPAPRFTLSHTIRGHSDWVTSVAFSTDGRRLASGSWDKSVKFWDVPTGAELHDFSGAAKRIQALAYSHDGRWLAAENADDSVTLWDTKSDGKSRTLAGRPHDKKAGDWVYSIAFSPDGRWLASGLDNKTVRIWDVNTGRPVRDLIAHPRSIIYVAFSPDGRLLASGDDDKNIRIWEAATGQVLATLLGDKRQVYAVAFSPDSQRLASAGEDKSVKLWDVASGRQLRTLAGHRSRVTSLAFRPDGRWLASGSWDKTIKIWDVESGQTIETLAGYAHDIYTIAFDSDGGWLASGSEDGTVKLWRVNERVGTKLER
jgi:WD40 repeat protein/putative methionine-R-sulfoxide reductase with GAF domain/CheY-like chemotaxis protein